MAERGDQKGGLPWYCVSTDFSGHPKTLELCGIVEDDNAGMYVVRLWEHCADHALDGIVRERVVEGVCQWKGKRGALLAALKAAGFLEPHGDGTVLFHGWEERNGARIREWLRSNAKRKPTRKPRENLPGDPENTPRGFDGGSPEEPRGPYERREKKQRTTAAATRAGASDAVEVARPEEPAKEDPARVNAGSGEGETPQREDGGDAAAAGIAAELRGAAGPAPSAAADPEPGQGASPTCPVTPGSSPGVRSVVVDEVPRPALVVVDEGGGAPGPDPWPRATSFRHAITLRMARTVLYPIGGVEPKIMGSLQDSLGVVPEVDAVELCAARVVEAVHLRKRQPGTLAYFAQVLADEAVRRRALGVTSLEPAAPEALPPAGCPEWERLRAALQERARPETFRKFHAPLVGRMDGDALVLTAPDPYLRDFLTDNHRGLFVDWVRELGVAADVRFEAAEMAAAGGAR